MKETQWLSLASESVADVIEKELWTVDIAKDPAATEVILASLIGIGNANQISEKSDKGATIILRVWQLLVEVDRKDADLIRAHIEELKCLLLSTCNIWKDSADVLATCLLLSSNLMDRNIKVYGPADEFLGLMAGCVTTHIHSNPVKRVCLKIVGGLLKEHSSVLKIGDIALLLSPHLIDILIINRSNNDMLVLVLEILDFLVSSNEISAEGLKGVVTSIAAVLNFNPLTNDDGAKVLEISFKILFLILSTQKDDGLFIEIIPAVVSISTSSAKDLLKSNKNFIFLLEIILQERELMELCVDDVEQAVELLGSITTKISGTNLEGGVDNANVANVLVPTKDVGKEPAAPPPRDESEFAHLLHQANHAMFEKGTYVSSEKYNSLLKFTQQCQASSVEAILRADNLNKLVIEAAKKIEKLTRENESHRSILNVNQHDDAKDVVDFPWSNMSEKLKDASAEGPTNGTLPTRWDASSLYGDSPSKRTASTLRKQNSPGKKSTNEEGGSYLLHYLSSTTEIQRKK